MMMETPPHASTGYPLHQVIPAENILVPSAPPSAAQLLLQHLPSTSSYRPGKTPKEQAEEYRLKYMTLKKKCHGIQLGNEKLLNRLYHVRKAVRKLTRERRFLMSKLDEFGDDYKSAKLPIPIEDESVLSMLSSGSNMPSNYSPPKESSGTKRSASPDDIKPDGFKPSLSIKTPSSSPAAPKRRRSSTQKSDKDKDPNAPKKPANAFLMFCQHERLPVLEEFSKENPQIEMSHQELTKELAKKWNDLTAEEKKTYYTLYEQDKRRYEREMRQYRSRSKPQSSATTTITSTINTTTPSQPTSLPTSNIALSTITKPSTPVVTSPLVTAPVRVQTKPLVPAPPVVQIPPAASLVVKQEPLNNNNSVVPSSLSDVQTTRALTSVVTPRTLPLSSISLTKPSASSSAATGHSLVTLTTSTSSPQVIPGATSYIKLSLGPNLTLAGSPTLLVPPKTVSGSMTVPKTSFPVTLTANPGCAPSVSGIQLNKQVVVTQISGQSVVNPSAYVALVTAGQDSKVTKTKQATISSRLAGTTTSATKAGSHVTVVTKSSGQGLSGTKKGLIKSSGANVVGSKPGGIATVGSKPGGIATMASLALATKTGILPGKTKGPMSTTSAGLSIMTPKMGVQTTRGPFNLTTKSSSSVSVGGKNFSSSTVGSKSVGQGSGLIFTGSKSIGQSSVATKIISQPIIATKIGGQAVFSLPGKVTSSATTKGGQAVSVSKLSGQAVSTSSKLSAQAITTKPSGMGTIASRLSAQGVGGQGISSRLSGVTMGGQGVSAAAVLSQLAAPGRTGEGATTSSTTPSRITTTSIHGVTSTQLSVAKETKKLLTSQKPLMSRLSLPKKEPEPSKSDDPYHFDD